MTNTEEPMYCPIDGQELVHSKGALGDEEPWVCMKCGYEEGGVSGSL